MRLFLPLFVGLFAAPLVVPGQFTPQQVDSLRQTLRYETTDSGRLKKLIIIGRGFLQTGKPDSMLVYADRAMALATAQNNPRAQSVAAFLTIWAYRHTGRYPQALQAAYANLQRAEQSKDSLVVLEALRNLMFTYNDMREFGQTLQQARRAQRLVHSGVLKSGEELRHGMFAGYLNFMAGAFEGLGQADSSLHYRRMAYGIAQEDKDPQHFAVSTEGLGRLYFTQKQYDSALKYYRACIGHVGQAGFRQELAAKAQLALAKIYSVRNQPDSSLLYAGLALATARRMKELAVEAEAASTLHALYANRQPKDSAYRYLLLATALRDSLVNKEKIKETETVKFAEALRRQKQGQEAQAAEQRYRNRLTTVLVSAALAVLLLTAFFIYRFRRLRQEARMKSAFTRQLQQTELRALRAQMNPHFVFNCLNSINRYIVKSDHATAADYLSRFARLIRFILDNSAAETIALDKEIETLQLYLQMEALRFTGAFDYAVEVDEGLCPETIAIPPMLLQPYVENAIWHGLLHKQTGNRRVRICFRPKNEDSLVAEIEDNGIGRRKARELKSKEALRKRSYGLRVTEERIFLLNELYQTSATVQIEDLVDEAGEGCGTRVTVTLPLRSAQPLANLAESENKA